MGPVSGHEHLYYVVDLFQDLVSTRLGPLLVFQGAAADIPRMSGARERSSIRTSMDAALG